MTWNRIDHLVRDKMEGAGVDVGHTYKWEEAVQAGVLTMSQIQDLTELRRARNRYVHSESVDRNGIAHWLRKSAEMLVALGGAL